MTSIDLILIVISTQINNICYLRPASETIFNDPDKVCSVSRGISVDILLCFNHVVIVLLVLMGYLSNGF